MEEKKIIKKIWKKLLSIQIFENIYEKKNQLN